MLSVTLRKDPKTGVYFLDYYFEGKRCRPSCGTRLKKVAELKKAEAELKLLKGEMGAASTQERVLLSILVRRYLELSEKTKTRRTYINQKSRLLFLVNYFAQRKIVYADQVNSAVLSEFVTTAGHFSPGSLNTIISYLKAALNQGVEWGLLNKNPIGKFRRFKVPQKLHLFSDSDLEKLLLAAEPELRAAICLGAYAGLRTDEIRHLRWKDIDFAAKTLTVRSDQEFTPKGKRGRIIPLHEKIELSLNRDLERKTPNDLLFPVHYQENTFRGYHWISLHFHNLCRKLKITGRFHDLRHTFGSRLVRAGVPLPVVRDLMGHANIQSTMIYIHVYPEQYRDAIEKL